MFFKWDIRLGGLEGIDKMDGWKGILDGFEVGVVVDVGLVLYVEECVSFEKVGLMGKVKKKDYIYWFYLWFSKEWKVLVMLVFW